MRYIVDWNPYLESSPFDVDHEEADDLKHAKAIAVRRSRVHGLAHVVAIDAKGVTVGSIGYARGVQDSKEGVFREL